MAKGKKGKKGSMDLAFMEILPADEDELEDEEELDGDDEEELESDLDEEGLMLAETALGDGDIETRAQALKDFVAYCSRKGDGY